MINNFLKKVAVLVLVMCAAQWAEAQPKKLFSGIYTIGGNNANYQTIQKALTDLLNANSEVIGRVTFNIRPGTYNENIVLKPFKGASPKNFVVFKSETGRAADVIIADDGDNTLYNNQVVRFEGSTYYTLQDLTIQNTRNIIATNNYASGIQFTYNRDNRKPSENNIVTRCVIKIDKDYTVFNGNAIAIVSSDINNTSIGGNCANFNTISNNTIEGGTFGLRLLGSRTLPARGNRVIGNKFTDCYNAIDVDSNNIPIIANNDITCRINPNESQFGIRVRNANGNFSFYNNVVRNFGTFGFFIYNVNGAAASYIYNNMILGNAKTGFSRGFHVEFSRSIQFLHNSVLYNAPYNTDNACFAIEFSDVLPSSRISLKNNIFVSTGGATTLIIRNTQTIDTCNYNDYFAIGSTVLGIINGTIRTNIAGIRAGTGKDQQSLNINPNFSTGTTLRLTNRLLIRKAFILPFITVDFENHPRDPEMPDYGADEVIRSDVDMEVFGLDKNFVPREGLNSLPVVIKNDGLLNLNGNSVNISYKVNTGAYTTPETFQLTQLNKSYFKQVFVLAAQWNIPSPGSYTLTIKVSPAVPNDTWQENDSVVLPICVGVNGRYTIGGPAGPRNYTNFQTALSAFDCGIGGPTVFDVYPGTYASFSLPNLKGSSAENTLLFRSFTGNVADVIIQNNTAGQTATTHPTVQVNGTDFVTFRNLTLLNTSVSTFASGFQIAANSNNVTVDSCVITVPTSALTTEFKFPIVVSDRARIDSGALVQNLTISNSILRNGVTSIQVYGRNSTIRSGGFRFINNKLDSAFLYGVSSTFSNIGEISGNNIRPRAAASANSEGIRIIFSKADTKINANRIFGVGNRGINLTSVEGVVNLLISNNMIGGGFKTTGNGSGIYLNEVNKVVLTHNSVLYDKAATTVPNLSAAFFLGSGVNVSLFNNVFSNPAGGYAFFVTNQNSLRASSNNNYYTDADPFNGLYAFYTIDVQTMQQLKTVAVGFENNSIETNPQFVSSTDLHSVNPAIEGKGVYLESTPRDFDGQLRNPLNTDLGADEVILSANDMALVKINPTVFNSNANTIKVEIMNLGSNSLNGIPVKLQYSSDGVNWVPTIGETFTAGSTANNSLQNPYDKVEFAFSTPFNASTNSSYNFMVRIKPEDRVSGDPVTKNDSILEIICTGLNAGTYTIGGVSPNFNTINDAVSALACGVTGKVVFKIRAGTYLERFTIGNPKNTSELNPIIFESESGNASDVVIRSNGVSSNTTRNVVRLNRSKFIEFRRLSFENFSGSIAGSAIFQLTSQAKNITIRECNLTMDTLSTSPGLFVITSSDSSSISSAGFSASNVKIIKNRIRGGYVGVYMRGRNQFQRESGIVIDSNIITNVASIGIFTSQNDVVSLHGNLVAMRKSEGSSVGVTMTVNREDTRFTNNTIYNAGTTGVSLEDIQGPSGLLFANNMVGANFGKTVDGSALDLKKIQGIKVYNNSLLFDGNNPFAAGMKVDANSKGIRLLNNSVYNSGTGFAFTITNYSGIDTSDNNNFATKGVLFARVNSFDYLSFEELREATLKDEKSISVDPDYFTSTNLKVSNVFMEGGGLVLKEVSTDIFGTPRDAEFPDIGAHEFDILGDVAMVKIDSPTMSPDVYPSLVPVEITISNNGQSKISGLNVKFYVDNVEIANEVIPVEDPYRPLLPTDVLTYKFVTKFEPIASGTYKLKVVLDLPDDIDLTNNSDSVEFFSSISSIVDASVTTFVSPANANGVKGKTPITVLLKNTGTVPIKDFYVNWDATNDTLSPKKELNTVELLPGDVISFSFEDSIDCDPRVVRILKVFVSDLAQEVILNNNAADMTILNFAPCGQIVGLDLVSENMFFAAPYPNPSNSQFKLDFSVLVEGSMNIELIDVLGRVLKVVSMDNLNPGQHQANINVDDVAPGSYMIRANFNGESVSTRVVVTK